MAENTPTWLKWLPISNTHAQKTNYVPYLYAAKPPQTSRWIHHDWYVEDWISQRKNGLDLVDGFYKADILKDQTDDDGYPVLVVGPNFYHLSGYDKRRVVRTVDVVYGMTTGPHKQSFALRDWNTKHYIGLYNENGLQLQ